MPDITLYVGRTTTIRATVVDVAGAPLDLTGATVSAAGAARGGAASEWTAEGSVADAATGAIELVITPARPGRGVFEVWIDGVAGVDSGAPVLSGRYVTGIPLVAPAPVPVFGGFG